MRAKVTAVVALCVAYLYVVVCEVVNLNHLAEPVFSEFRRTIQDLGQDRVRVTDLAEKYKVTIFGYDLRLLNFRCTNGWVSNITSIERAGDILMYPVDSSVAIELPFRFSDLRYDCDSYLLEVPILRFGGRMNARVGRNQFDLKVLLEFVDEECTFRIDRFRTEHLDNIKIRLTGFSIFNSLMNKVITGVAEKFQSAISKRFLEELQRAVINHVEEAKLCRHRNGTFSDTNSTY